MLLGLFRKIMRMQILMLLKDEGEYVCEDCGTIYGVDKLVFKHADGEDKTPDELDAILNDVFKEDKLSSSHIATYLCPNCRRIIVIPDRRQKPKR